MAEAGLTWGREPRRAGVARLKNGCEPPPCGTGRWASWGSARRPQQECGPVGVAMTEEGSGLCQDQGRRPKPSSHRAGPAPASAPTSSRRPGAGSQEGPGCRQGRGSRLRVLSVRLLSALQSLCLSRSPACPGNREPRPLCLGYVASKTHPGTEDAVLDRGRTRAPGVPTSQSPSRGLWAGDAGQWGIESLLWRTGREAVGTETTRSVVSGPAEARRPPSPARPGARDPPRLATPRRSVGLYFYSFNFFFLTDTLSPLYLLS